MNFFGLFLGIATLLIIGLGFLWVVRCEYYLGFLWWPYILGLGILVVTGSLFAGSAWISALMGVSGASIVWGGAGRDRLVPFQPGSKA
jgi:hypothetical protein